MVDVKKKKGAWPAGGVEAPCRMVVSPLLAGHIPPFRPENVRSHMTLSCPFYYTGPQPPLDACG